MPLRVNPIILLGIIIAFLLTVAAFASAMGSPGDAVAVATAQVGKPYAFGTDGPGTFSCAGLMRYALRNAGVDANAPWGHGDYLSVYPNDPTPQVGDIVVYPSGVAMYIGGDTVVMANAADGVVGTYPMYSIGTPLGFANPYGTAAAPATTGDPAMGGMTDPTAMGTTPTGPGTDPTVLGTDPTMPTNQTAVDPLTQPLNNVADPSIPAQGGVTDPLTQPLNNVTDPLTQAPLQSPYDATLAPYDATLVPYDATLAPYDGTQAPAQF
jgi:hypothetical protein